VRKRTFWIFLLILIAVGAGIACCLGSWDKLELFKLLNVIGLLYGLLGVLVLSEFVLESPKWRNLVIERVSGVLLWVHLGIPIGAAVTSLFLALLASKAFPSAAVFGSASFAFFLWTVPGGLLLENFVFVPKWPRFREPAVRTRTFGLLLVAGGLVAQLVAAIQDMLRS
jgi:hypothetical protein